MERVEQPEMLDSDQWTQKEVTCALSAIRRVNRLYGGDRMHKRLFQCVAERLPSKKMDVLEVASARGEVLQAVARNLLKIGISVQATLLDRNQQHLPQPGDWLPELPQPVLLVGDALSIPLKDNCVDVVSCCLFLHHLNADDTRRFFQEALRVSRIAVLINDVERTRTNHVLSHLQTLIDPSRLSRHDGPASVRQAYTFSELEALLRESKRRFELERGFLFRLGATIWKERAA